MSETSKHTPAPWTADSPGVLRMGERLVTIGYKNVTYPDGFRCQGLAAFPLEERKANAYLLAAAPDLLVAARFALSVLKPITIELSERMAVEKLEAAIAKAEGITT